MRRGDDKDAALPVPRAQLAEALGTSLCRVKRTLALLSLSGVAKVEGATLRITDWRRLAGLGCYDPARLGLAPEEAELEIVPAREAAPRLTAAGDPACFV